MHVKNTCKISIRYAEFSEDNRCIFTIPESYKINTVYPGVTGMTSISAGIFADIRHMEEFCKINTGYAGIL